MPPFSKGGLGGFLTTAIILLVASLALVGCVQTVPREAVAVGFAPTPEATREPTPTPSPTPTPTPVPTPTPTPQPTSTPEPTLSVNPSDELFLDLQTPDFGATVRVKNVRVAGLTVPGTTLEVGLGTEKEVVRVERDGTFETEVALDPGQNVIEVRASGLHGGQLRDFVIVTYDPPPPPLFRLVVHEPPNLVVVADQPILVSGHTTVIQALVTVNGVKVTVDDEGRFSTSVRLTEGVNQIEVQALHPDKLQSLRDTRSVTYSPP